MESHTVHLLLACLHAESPKTWFWRVYTPKTRQKPKNLVLACLHAEIPN